MLRDDAISLLTARMTRADLTQVVPEMQLAQTRLETLPMLPWFLLQDITTLATVADDDRIALPSDFLRESDEDEGALWLTDLSLVPTLFTPLKKRTHGQLIAEYAEDEAGTPEKYAVMAGYIRLRPVPDAVFTTRFVYYGRGATLSTNIENVWLLNAPELLIARTGMQLSKYDNDTAMYELFKEDYILALGELTVADEARRMAGMDALMGEEDA